MNMLKLHRIFVHFQRLTANHVVTVAMRPMPIKEQRSRGAKRHKRQMDKKPNKSGIFFGKDCLIIARKNSYNITYE